MNSKLIAAITASTACVVILGSGSAFAESTGVGAPYPDEKTSEGAAAQSEKARAQQQETVSSRPRPEYDALGLRAEGFYFYPRWTQTEMFDDNIFATPSGGKSDLISIFSPGFQVRSDFNQHALSFGARADIGKYMISPTENYDDWALFGDSRIDVSRDIGLVGSLTFAHRHEDRGSPDAVNGKTPTTFYALAPSLGGYWQLGRFSVRTETGLTRYDYNNVEDNVGNVIIQNDRDRTEYSGGARFGYEIVPNYEAFVSGSYNNRVYNDKVDQDGFRRSSHGWEVDTGAAIDLTGVLFGNVFAGYHQQYYQDSRFQTSSGVGFGADMTWNVTKLTTVKALIQRQTEETTQIDASGYNSMNFGASVDHELLRNVILSANGSYQINDYKGVSRTDDLIRAGAGGKYLINRYASLGLAYNFLNRKSDVAGEGFTINQVLLTLDLQM
jgi:hypothetical protein